MYTSPSLVLAALAVLARVVIATPPACLLAALGAQPDPADVKSLCGSGFFEGNITSKCTGADESDALSAYSSTCSAAGVTISITSSGSSSVTATSSGAETTGTAASAVSTGTVESTTIAAPTATAGASVTSTVASVAGPTDSTASASATAKSNSSAATGGYSTGNSTSLSGVAKGTGAITTTRTTTIAQTSQTSTPPISAGARTAANFSSFRFRLMALLSAAALQMV